MKDLKLFYRPIGGRCPPVHKLATKIAKVCCNMLLLAHPANFIIDTFVVVIHKIFSVRLFCAHSAAVLGVSVPLCPPSFATDVNSPIKIHVFRNRVQFRPQ